MKNKKSFDENVERALNEMPTEVQEKVREMAGLSGIGGSSKISPVESRSDKFYWIPILMLIIGPWAFLIWMGIDIDMVLLGAAVGLWSAYLSRQWLREYERRHKLEAKMYGEVKDDNEEDE